MGDDMERGSVIDDDDDDVDTTLPISAAWPRATRHWCHGQLVTKMIELAGRRQFSTAAMEAALMSTEEGRKWCKTELVSQLATAPDLDWPETIAAMLYFARDDVIQVAIGIIDGGDVEFTAAGLDALHAKLAETKRPPLQLDDAVRRVLDANYTAFACINYIPFAAALDTRRQLVLRIHGGTDVYNVFYRFSHMPLALVEYAQMVHLHIGSAAAADLCARFVTYISRTLSHLQGSYYGAPPLLEAQLINARKRLKAMTHPDST